MSADDPEWGVMLFNQKDIDVSCQDRWWLAQNVPVHRFPWLTIGDHAIARRTEMSEASSLKFNLSDVNQNRRSVVHDVYQKMQRHWRKNTPPTDANRNSSSICCMLIFGNINVSFYVILHHFRHSTSNTPEWDILFSGTIYQFCESFPLQQLWWFIHGLA